MGDAGSFFEPLERRTLLSGTVRAFFDDGFLHLVGDDSSNAIVVQRDYADPNASAIEVIGQDGTLINGVTQFGGFHFTGVRAIRVDLNGGDDQAHFVGLRLASDLTIAPGAGNDDIFIRKSRIFGNTLIGEGRDGDTLTVADTFFQNDLTVIDKSGATSISLRDAVFGDNLSIATGTGADRLTMNNCFVEGFSYFSTGDGDDFVRIAEGSEFRQATTLDDGDDNDLVYREVLRRFDFDRGKQGWKGYFSNYPAGQPVGKDADGEPISAEEGFRLESGIKALPDSRIDQQRGFYLGGVNGTDNMLFFLARTFAEADGLIRGQAYRAEISFRYNSPQASPSRRLMAGAISGPIRLDLVAEKFTDHSNLLLVGKGGVEAEAAGDLQEIAELTEGVVQLSAELALPAPSQSEQGWSIVIALKNEFENFASIYFEAAQVRFVPEPS